MNLSVSLLIRWCVEDNIVLWNNVSKRLTQHKNTAHSTFNTARIRKKIIWCHRNSKKENIRLFQNIVDKFTCYNLEFSRTNLFNIGLHKLFSTDFVLRQFDYRLKIICFQFLNRTALVRILLGHKLLRLIERFSMYNT